jgi:hypothetical protein
LLGAICFGPSGLGWVAARVCVVRVNRFGSFGGRVRRRGSHGPLVA